MTGLLQRTIRQKLREQKERKISLCLTSDWARSPNRSSIGEGRGRNDHLFAQFSFALAREPSSRVSAAHQLSASAKRRDHRPGAGRA
jgi:hypothetical protein